MAVAQRPGCPATQQHGVHRRVGEAAELAEAGEGGTNVADAAHLVPQPAPADLGGEAPGLRRAPVRQRLRHRLGRQHAGLHRRVGALDLGHVEEAGAVADQRAARKGQLRDGLQSALVQRPRAVGNAPSAFKVFAHFRMRLEPLHFIKRRQPGVLVVQPNDEPKGDQVLAKMIQPRSTVSATVQWPTYAVLNQAWFVIGRRDFPKLLDAEPGIDLDAQRFRLAGKPATHVAQADDEVAVVAHLRRHRKPPRAPPGEVEQVVLGGRGVERSAPLPPVRDQLVQRARLDHGARQDVRADLRALLDQADRGVGRALFQTDRGRKPGRAAADHHHVELHRLAQQPAHQQRAHLNLSRDRAGPALPVMCPWRGRGSTSRSRPT